MNVTTCDLCSAQVVIENDGTCPACGGSPLATSSGAARGTLKARIDAWLDQPAWPNKARGASGAVNAPTIAWPNGVFRPKGKSAASVRGMGFFTSLIIGFLAAKGAGFAVYLLTSDLTRDPLGTGLLLGQVLFLAVRAVGGYVGGLARQKDELALAVWLGAIDVGSMAALSAVVRWLGLGPVELQEIVRSTSMTDYLLEAFIAVPGYIVGGGLARIQRRYASTRASRSATASLGRRVIFLFSGGMLCIIGVLLCLGAFIVCYKSTQPGSPPLFSLDMLILTFTWTVGGFLGTGAYAIGKRLWAAGAPPLTATPEFVVLRAFQDDAIAFQGGNFLSERFLPSAAKSLEEILVIAARRYGRAAAIGDPRESLPRPGALRTYFEATDDTHWRDQALAYIDGCKHILVVLGSGEGVRWEYGQLADRNALNRTILVVSPRGAGSWAEFRNTVAEHGVHNLPDALPPNTILVRFDDEGRPRFYKSTKMSADAYFERLHQALSDKKAGRNSPGEVKARPARRAVTFIGVLLMAPLCALQGGALGWLAVMALSRWAGEPGQAVGAVVIGLGAVAGLIFGVVKGATIKRFS
ncbi:hypothetical protein [Paludisphaera borealis]|uniref:Uncharacterized protein n=1 Tax=Paludisphaera borealis TaxID=1387353 RepID=A0A1U7CS26_9BACT|nr:hypothetical protein [Paludisphaera borealis]APW61708.1 hypothetical protein BSF38_03235 [Paludisphaera borealis]